MRLFYVDDSGAESSRTVVFGWVELLVTDWRPALRMWLDWRQALNSSVGLPASYELHGTKFANGRGRPTGTDWDHHKAHRSTTMVDALSTIARLPGVQAGAIYRKVPARTKYYDGKATAYADLVAMLDQRLTNAGELGMVVMDGDGTDPLYRTTHRGLKLATRSIIEDPIFQGSHLSQWVQMADLVAYSAYMAVLQAPGKAALWGWYPDLLGPTSSTGQHPLNL
jgi:hypothetical protein